MDPRNYWSSYVKDCGGLAATALKLGTPYQTIASITNGHRGIGHRLARRFVERDPSLDAGTLVWVRPIPKAA